MMKIASILQTLNLPESGILLKMVALLPEMFSRTRARKYGGYAVEVMSERQQLTIEVEEMVARIVQEGKLSSYLPNHEIKHGHFDSIKTNLLSPAYPNIWGSCLIARNEQTF